MSLIDIDQAHEYVRLLIHDDLDPPTGWLHTAIGHGPHVVDGHLKHDRWQNRRCEYPRGLATPSGFESELKMLAEHGEGCDIYVCPNVLKGDHRHKDTAVRRKLLHADLDRPPDPDKLAALKALGALWVESGTAGHLHLYLRLTYAVTMAQYGVLMRGLRDWIGGDNKVNDNDLLRLPGTLNYKSSPPGPVTLVVSEIFRRVPPPEVAALIGVDITRTEESDPGGKHKHSGSATGSPSSHANVRMDPFKINSYPKILAALKKADVPNCDRSAVTYAVVGVVFNTMGMTLENARYAVNSSPILAERIEEMWTRPTPWDDVGMAWSRLDQGLPPEAEHKRPTGEQSADEHWDHARAVDVELRKMRIRDEAKRIFAEEQASATEVALPEPCSLGGLLAEPDLEQPFIIGRLLPEDSRVILSAAYKAGKSTMVGNLIRSLADGDPFLGEFELLHPGLRVALIDNELGQNRLRGWLRGQGIDNTDALVDAMDMRGRCSGLNITSDRVRARLARRLADQGAEVLLFDCLRPALDAAGLDERTDAGVYLQAFDQLMLEASIGSAVLVHHMGHSGERSRGDSRLLDWPDASWRITRPKADGDSGPDNPDAPRFFSAYGRDVDVSEGHLILDGRRLTYQTGVGRKQQKGAEYIPDVLLLLASDQRDGGTGLSKNQIETRVAGKGGRNAIREAIQLAVERGLVRAWNGHKNAKMHAPVNPCSRCGYPEAWPQHCPEKGE